MLKETSPLLRSDTASANDDSGAVVALSGGVDSAVSAMLCLQAGMKVTGVTLAMGSVATEHAQGVCDVLGIEHLVVDASELFERCVVNRFVENYAAGMTPNPCVICNPLVKSRMLAEVADELGHGRVVTGHYAGIRVVGEERHLLRARDHTRDQSYMLYRLGQEALRMLVFPLGELYKREVRRLAAKAQLPVADRPDSQDVCFIPDGKILDLIAERCPEAARPGEILDTEARVLGEHQGIAAYTIGQRQGLGIGGQAEPLFVLRIIPERNALVAGPEEALWLGECELAEVCLIGDPPGDCFEAAVATRYRGRETPARVELTEKARAQVRFKRPHRAPAPGQSAVFYVGERCLGGGIIAPRADRR